MLLVYLLILCMDVSYRYSSRKVDEISHPLGFGKKPMIKRTLRITNNTISSTCDLVTGDVYTNLKQNEEIIEASTFRRHEI